MPNRTPNQDAPNKVQKNPGKFSPDDDEAQEADVTRATDMPRAAEQQHDMETAIEDEEGEGDEDEADGRGARPA